MRDNCIKIINFGKFKNLKNYFSICIETTLVP